MSLEKLLLRGLGCRVEGSGCKNLCCRTRDWREVHGFTQRMGISQNWAVPDVHPSS